MLSKRYFVTTIQPHFPYSSYVPKPSLISQTTWLHLVCVCLFYALSEEKYPFASLFCKDLQLVRKIFPLFFFKIFLASKNFLLLETELIIAGEKLSGLLHEKVASLGCQWKTLSHANWMSSSLPRMRQGSLPAELKLSKLLIHQWRGFHLHPNYRSNCLRASQVVQLN